MFKQRFIKLTTIIFSSIIIISCGGGGGSSEPPVIEPTFAFDAPSTLTNNSTPSTSGCTGTTWDDCIKLTATATDPQNRLITKEWRTYRSNSNNCEPYTRQGDNIISSPLYCGHNGYRCSYSYQWEFRNRDSEGDIFTSFRSQDISVNVNAIPCVSGSAIDGYIQEAQIFADINFNLKQDSDEPVVVSNQLGQFRFNQRINDGTILILKGGIDSTTQVEFPKNYTLIGKASNQEKIVISPISTINFFMPSDYSANDDFEFKSFDVFYDDPLIQMTSPEAIKVLETNMRISILAESLSRITYQDDYIEIYKEITNQLIDAGLGLQDISSTKLITNAILNISAINGLSKVNVNDTSLALSNYLNGVIVDDTNQYVDIFNHGINVLPLQLAQFSDGKDINISMYINEK